MSDKSKISELETEMAGKMVSDVYPLLLGVMQSVCIDKVMIPVKTLINGAFYRNSVPDTISLIIDSDGEIVDRQLGNYISEEVNNNVRYNDLIGAMVNLHNARRRPLVTEEEIATNLGSSGLEKIKSGSLCPVFHKISKARNKTKLPKIDYFSYCEEVMLAIDALRETDDNRKRILKMTERIPMHRKVLIEKIIKKNV